MPHTLFVRPESDRFLVEPLPDGSAAVFDSASESVHSLNQTAALVWECCSEPAALADIADVVRRVTGLPEPRAVAEDALNQLQRSGLVEARRVDDHGLPSRRTALRMIGRGSSIAFLAPLVQTMTVGQQHALAQGVGSPVTTTLAPTTTSSTTTLQPTTTTTLTAQPRPYSRPQPRRLQPRPYSRQQPRRLQPRPYSRPTTTTTSTTTLEPTTTTTTSTTTTTTTTLAPA